jgi:hypothetical protein
MKLNRAAATRFLALSLLMGAASAGLAGCGSIDDALFGTESPSPAGAQAADQSGGQSAEQSGDQNAEQTEGGEAQAGVPATVAATSAPTGSGFTPIPIEGGSDTGTTVSKTVQNLRGELTALQDKIMGDAQQFANLKSTAAQATTSYHEATAHITTRLQVGTTRGNPELVSEWNTAQTSLDTLTTNINALNALGTQISNEASRAHYEFDTIQASFNLSGAVDEDHRQLTVMQDETSQLIMLTDRMLTNVSQQVQRQTSYVANERGSLTTLASAIKNGEYYGSDLGSPMPAPMASSYGSTASGPALVTIRFDHPHVAYQQILYTALNQALQTRPSATFNVVAVSPTRGSAAAVQLAQSEAQHHAQDVLRSMSDMGVPASRLGISSSTDPGIGAAEVRVFVR